MPPKPTFTGKLYEKERHVGLVETSSRTTVLVSLCWCEGQRYIQL